MKELDDVKDFQTKFSLGDHPQVPSILENNLLDQRIQLMQEELNEFKAASYPAKGRVVDLAGQADALVDLVYVTLGTVAIMGLPWEKLWDDVHRANMSKVRGMTHRGHNNDVTKPEGWVGPKTTEILLKAIREEADRDLKP